MENDSNNRANGNEGPEVEVDSPVEVKPSVRANESTSLSPNNNQTYFANERIKIPERESVSIFKYNFEII